jgi:hypothetical protein
MRTTNSKPQYPISGGYVYECTADNWRVCRSDDWEIVCGNGDKDAQFVGYRLIDDCRCAVFVCSDQVIRAVTVASCR